MGNSMMITESSYLQGNFGIFPFSNCSSSELLTRFILYLTVWGVEPVLTHHDQTPWLASTGVREREI